MRRQILLYERVIALLQAIDAAGQILGIGRPVPEEHPDLARSEVGAHQLVEAVDIMAFLSYGYQVLGQLQPAIDLIREAIATDPLRADWYSDAAGVLMAQGRLDAAEQAIRKALALQPDFPYLYAGLGEIDILRGDAAAAVHDARQETDPGAQRWLLLAAQQIGPDREQADAALRNYIAKYGKTEPYTVADLYAVRKQPDEMFEWLQRTWTGHGTALVKSLLSDPFVLPYQHDPRFTALCKEVGLPVPGETLSGDGVPVSASSSRH
ncbi:MAG: tetratricopeptide repeat protein [Rhodanobacteraceae bacterium]